MASVTLKQIKKTYSNGFEALQPCSFTVEHGELLVLVGPSGCGKSTLLRMVAGLEEITGGELYIGERLVNEVDPANRDIAMVFQNYALYPHMSVSGNMGYGLRNRGVSKSDIARKVHDAAEMLNLTDYLDRKPSQLSGGQRQRVAMGRAIVRSPELFLFDEPLSNLDAKLRNQMRIEIRSLQRRLGVTSLYVTHDQVEAMTLADRIIVLNEGRVEQIGSPTEIYNEPASTFVASFMGAPPMNILNADVADNRAMLGHEISFPTPSSSTRSSSNSGHSLDSGPVNLGVRPEDASLNTEGELPFEVQIIEELGASRLLHGTLAYQPFSVSVSKDVHATTGEQRIDIAHNALHWFYTTNGKRIYL